MSDKIVEIRARHTGDANDAAVLNPELSPTWALAGWRAHNDRAFLLAEVERQARHIDELRAKVDAEKSCACSYDAPGDICAAHSPALAKAQAEIERLTRERDEARAALKPFSELYLWPDDTGRLLATRVRSREDWDEAANDEESNPYYILRGEIRAARKALEAKP